MIYLDNAATSYPKNEPALRRALERYLALGASPGRGGYDRAVETEEMVEKIRRKILRFFGAPPGSHVCFSANATDALNTLIQGLAEPEIHLLSTRLEHNSVLRPLHHIKRNGLLEFDLVDFNLQGFIEPKTMLQYLRPGTRAVIINHASNVLGTVQPIAALGSLLRSRNIALCVDASQSAGLIPIHMEQENIAALAFTGHKSLGGPTGTGALIITPELELKPSRYGGTGVDSLNLYQPAPYPARLEAGTQNMFGILALEECLQTLPHQEQERRLKKELHLTKLLYEALSALPGVNVYGAHDMNRQVPLLSCTVDGMQSSDVGAVLDGDFDIAVRTGLQCAPLVHETLGTSPYGTIRFSLGPHTTQQDVEAAIRAMREIVTACRQEHTV
ncbi:aminotransferase class V-fold PLP-dependent enzyme [Desulfogranum japonicum]|uniref:aminotransferase class V-fold PLP-dependent enzyme n=1 Tax=Desulfogranum japonicum TaxID=231447 RepID=UPI000405490C|nr:aminotransferase class V-fold PLP-dependent enzyme [Desulfogranum japonicum]